MTEQTRTLEESLGVDAGQIVADPEVPAGWVCRGCGATTHRLYRGENPHTARCIRCLAGLPPRETKPLVAQMDLGL